MRYLIPLTLLFLACGHADPTPVNEVKTLSGHVRYQEDSRTLNAELLLADSTDRAPTFLGTPMLPLHHLPARRFRLERVQKFDPTMRFAVSSREEVANFKFDLVPVYIDSLPDTLVRTRTANFPAAGRGLAENESLVIFFEPADRSTPKRILLTGPTSKGIITLPTSAIDDIPPGSYEVYLIKQHLYKDRQRNLRASIQAEYFTRSRHLTVE